MNKLLPDAVMPLVDEARSDPEKLGVLLTGSRTSGAALEQDDYDVYVVVSDTALDRLANTSERRGQLEIVYLSPQLLTEMAAVQGWWTYSLASAEVLLDKTGEVAALIDASRTLSSTDADQVVADSYDEYLRFFVRAMRAHARGDPLGARLHAVESLIRLARLLFALKRRPVPYHDRLHIELDTLTGWPATYLQNAFTQIANDGDPELQRDLQRRVETLMERNGILAHRRWGNRLRNF